MRPRVTSIISLRGGRGVPDGDLCIWAIWESLPSTGTYYSRHQAPWAQCHFLNWAVTIRGCHFSRLTYKFYGVWWPLRVASWKSGDASVTLCFREINVSPRARRVYLATRFDFRETKIVLVLGRLKRLPSTLPFYYTMKGGRRRLFFPAETSCMYKGQQQLSTW